MPAGSAEGAWKAVMDGYQPRGDADKYSGLIDINSIFHFRGRWILVFPFICVDGKWLEQVLPT